MIKLLSLFSGIGAFEKALENINVDYELVNYCEIDKFASYAYSILHKVDESLNLGDISKVDVENLNDFDLLTYGFPCQDISLAGKKRGIIKGETRSGLLFEALKIIEAKKPKYAIAENVKNLTSKMFIDDFNNMLEELNEIGYNSYWKILNSKDYGGIQSRERVFIVSIRKDIDNGNFKFPELMNSHIPLSEITEKNIDEKYYCKENIHIKKFLNHVSRKIVDFKNPNKFGLLRVGKIDNPNMLNMNKRVFSDLGVSPTITTGSDSIPKIIQCRIRRLTPLECWKLTGFTDKDYWNVRRALEKRFYGNKDKTDTQMYKMAGNSIVVNVVESIFKLLFSN
ncbi:DNA cytosine methyltransferase [Clostridium beijerinckii]|uniref:DNA cytosine methyltransferase n=1 Tax=Clostridium beijerinckii TaxID=1520 RepID=UPI0009C4CCE4|nr:DNA cytosine methyltransferase [Clostridium beijerinckii]MBA8937247.1 DNA (cytosine-5)-methyltransferase 1 [Clostridium beijerinckii]NRU40287.1 DNA (cytosine-5)-methyltransferase 1 [Clostridium beijerinckii]NSA96436.1 DNA (cytosine-5)-methyltransferase 1 [Clostridium beijerinckii]OOM60657.1 modification methylase HhaI [Clostridium beijerinckii]OOM68579.1 modification methylase HhaI [Clostridium beijerinckii]